MKNNEQLYADYLYWELMIKRHIDFHAFMELFKKKFNRYPTYDEVCTFKMAFIDEWYRNIEDYVDVEEAQE